MEVELILSRNRVNGMVRLGLGYRAPSVDTKIGMVVAVEHHPLHGANRDCEGFWSSTDDAVWPTW
jgi:hypothetical protein